MDGVIRTLWKRRSSAGTTTCLLVRVTACASRRRDQRRGRPKNLTGASGNAGQLAISTRRISRRLRPGRYPGMLRRRCRRLACAVLDRDLHGPGALVPLDAQAARAGGRANLVLAVAGVAMAVAALRAGGARAPQTAARAGYRLLAMFALALRGACTPRRLGDLDAALRLDAVVRCVTALVRGRRRASPCADRGRRGDRDDYGALDGARAGRAGPAGGRSRPPSCSRRRSRAPSG